MNQNERLDILLNAFSEEAEGRGSSLGRSGLGGGKTIRSALGGRLSGPLSEDEKRNTLRALMNVRMPLPMDAEILKIQDEYLSERAKERGIVRAEDIPCVSELGSGVDFSERIALWQGDITKLSADAIVNAANSAMLGCFVPLHNCIDNCIHSYAGIELRAACNEQMEALRKKYGRDYEQPTAVPMLTAAYNLPAKKVVHIVGPIVYSRLTPELEEDLRNCYTRTLSLCAENGLKSVAFCCISTGVFNFPQERAAELALESVQKWLSENDAPPENSAETRDRKIEKIIFNVFGERDKEIYRSLLF